jgi:hypothetical protein
MSDCVSQIQPSGVERKQKRTGRPRIHPAPVVENGVELSTYKKYEASYKKAFQKYYTEKKEEINKRKYQYEKERIASDPDFALKKKLQGQEAYYRRKLRMLSSQVSSSSQVESQSSSPSSSPMLEKK